MWTLLAALNACAPPPYTPPADDTGDAPDDTGVSLSIDWPKPETPATGCAMFVVSTPNLRLTDPVLSPDTKPGEGHYHLIYDGMYTPCVTPYCLVTLQTQGLYEVQAVAVGNDHVELLDDNEEIITDTLVLDVTPGECDLGIPLAGNY
ncbi:MAG: hypothetical protein EXR71_13475 [Myxococcales bacterium]|nr:hypothetical protein [Myxococcales bacterium]